jgi:hypothetical protein
VDSIEKDLPSHMRLSRDQSYNLPAIIDAIDEVFENVDDFIEEAQKQLYFPTATGKYAIQLASMKGFTLQRGSGISVQQGAGVNIDGFKKIAPIVTTSPKQVYGTLAKLLEVFYSSELVKANILSDQYEDYQLMPDDTLVVSVSGELKTITFASDAFSDFQEITASSLASYINYLAVGVTASSVVNRSSGRAYTRLITDIYGASGSIEVIGGTAASILYFPNYYEPYHEVGTQLLLTKPASQDSLVTVTWSGAGTDPQFYRLAPGDYVSFRNLFDVASSGVQAVDDTDEWGYETGTTTNRNLVSGNYSILNTYHEIISVGYNFFTIRVYGFYPASNSGNIFLRSIRDMYLQKHVATRVYEQEEFAILSESDTNTVTVTVPAVSPLILRGLKGAWHIHGAVADVTAFDRNSVTMSMQTVDFPDESTFVVRSPRIEETYSRLYRSVSRAGDVWTLDPSDSELFPYTTAELVNTGTSTPFYCALDSDRVVITTGEPHYCLAGMSVKIASAGVNETFNVNGTFPVESIQNSNQLTIKTPSALPGITITQRVSIVRLPAKLANGANAYIQFASALDLTNSGIAENTRVKLVVDGTTVVNDAVAVFRLLNGYIGIVEISGDTAYVSAALTAGAGNVCSNALLRRAIEYWGGSPTYFVDLTLASNASFFDNMQAILVNGYTSTNELFLGSYLYDSTAQYGVTMRFATLATAVSAGSSGVILTVSSDASDWDNSGYLVIGYGTARVEGPIAYTAVYQYSSTQWKVVLDPTYIFDKTQAIGRRIWIVSALEAPDVGIYGDTYVPYLTSTVSARTELFRLIGTLVAAGVVVENDTNYPELKFEDESLSIYD